MLLLIIISIIYCGFIVWIVKDASMVDEYDNLLTDEQINDIKTNDRLDRTYH